jgi:hypothetical protein
MINLKGDDYNMLLSIGKVSKITGKPIGSIRYLEESEMLIPFKKSKGGTRYYSLEQVEEYFGKDNLDISKLNKEDK